MIESLKALWAKWKVQISLVGGVLILSTVWGTCSYAPAQDEEVEEPTEASEEVTEEASNSSEAPAEVEAASNIAKTTTTATTSTENNSVETVDSTN